MIANNTTNSGPCAMYYEQGGNREFFDPNPNQLDINSTWIPNFALMPAKIARKAIK